MSSSWAEASRNVLSARPGLSCDLLPWSLSGMLPAPRNEIVSLTAALGAASLLREVRGGGGRGGRGVLVTGLGAGLVGRKPPT